MTRAEFVTKWLNTEKATTVGGARAKFVTMDDDLDALCALVIAAARERTLAEVQAAFSQQGYASGIVEKMLSEAKP